MKRVIIESPYAGDIDLNLRYLRACMADCISRGEAPFASHGLYTQPGVLRDEDPEERRAGIDAGFVWRKAADFTAVYTDLGTSRGMEYGIAHAADIGHEVVFRSLGADWQRVMEPRDGWTTTRSENTKLALECVRLRDGLRTALDEWERSTDPEWREELGQIAELRKLVSE